MRIERWAGLALCCALAACGGSESGDGGDDAGAAEGAAGTPSGARSACDLVTAAEMQAITGEPVEVRPGEGAATYSKCEYWGTVNEVPYFSLTAYWSGGREQWEIHASAMGLAADLFREAEGVELDSIVQAGPVAGLGDAAIYADLTPAVVLRGDQMLEMYLFYLPDAKRNFRPLTEKILARL
jgi:hypothetical protein